MQKEYWNNETFQSLIKKKHEEQGNLTALCLGANDETELSFTNLYYSIVKIQTFLLQNFSGCHIAIVGENSSEWYIAYLGILCSDCVAVLIEKELPQDVILSRLKYSDCQVVFLSEEYIDYREIFEKNGISVISLEWINAVVKNVLGGDIEREAELKCCSDSDAPAEIIFTSGTSGHQKAVVLSRKNILADFISSASRFPKDNNSIYMIPLPLYHTFTLACALGITLVYGHIVHLTAPKNIMKDLMRLHPYCVVLVPAIVEMIYDRIKDMDNENIKVLFGDQLVIISGGANLPTHIQSELCEKGIPIIQGYGMTECSPIISVDDITADVHLGSVGRAIDCCEISVFEPDENGVGELAVKGDNIMLGYYKNPESTKQNLRDGFFYTGDIGYIDNNGYIYITGRKKNLIILSNGKNVSPEELERMFSAYSYIQDACVYARNDKIIGEFYLDTEKYPNAETLLKKDVVFINKKLPKYKNISEIQIRKTPFERNNLMKKIRKE